MHNPGERNIKPKWQTAFGTSTGMAQRWIVMARTKAWVLQYSPHLCWLHFHAFPLPPDLPCNVSPELPAWQPLMMGCWSHELQSSWALSPLFQTHPLALGDAGSFSHISQLPGYQVKAGDKCWVTVCLTLLPPWPGIQPSPFPASCGVKSSDVLVHSLFLVT